MGGTIAVTIREPNGTEHRMARWTNPTPYFINSMGLVNKDPKHLAKYMSQWNEMREDWLDHLKRCKKKDHINCKMKFNMTACYALKLEEDYHV